MGLSVNAPLHFNLEFRSQFRNSKSVSGEPPSDWQILLEEEAIPRGLGAPALSTVTLSDPTKAKRAGSFASTFRQNRCPDRAEIRRISAVDCVPGRQDWQIRTRNRPGTPCWVGHPRLKASVMIDAAEPFTGILIFLYREMVYEFVEIEGTTVGGRYSYVLSGVVREDYGLAECPRLMTPSVTAIRSMRMIVRLRQHQTSATFQSIKRIEPARHRRQRDAIVHPKTNGPPSAKLGGPLL